MKLVRTQKSFIGIFCVMTAVMLCMLPFRAYKAKTIFVYSQTNYPTSQERGFVRELKNLGYRVHLNSKKNPQYKDISFWFKDNNQAINPILAQTKINFIYNEDLYPIDWQKHHHLPIFLTPYQALFEHYARSNVKSALFNIGLNTADFYPTDVQKIYPLIYYGDNNLFSPLAEFLKSNDKVKFLGDFWNTTDNLIQLKKNETVRTYLNQAQIVAVYIPEDPTQIASSLHKVMEASACGALVISNQNDYLKNIYGDSLVYYRDLKDFASLTNYYLKNPSILFKKAIEAQKITLAQLSSTQAAQRLHLILQNL